MRTNSKDSGWAIGNLQPSFKIEIFNLLHDQLIVELNNRFAERSTQLLRCIACLDPKNSFANYNEDKLVDLANMFLLPE